MRNYTNGQHPAGGADPNYLNYGRGVIVPNLINPRIPGPGISLKPQHHVAKYIGVIPSSVDDHLYDDDYYEEEDGDVTESHLNFR